MSTSDKEQLPVPTLHQLELVFRNAPDFIGVSDIDGNPLFANDAALNMVGLSWGEMLQTHVPDYFVPEERTFVNDVVLPTALNDGIWDGELTFQHFKTGRRIPVLYRVFRIDDPDTGTPVSFATITHDLTEQKQHEINFYEAERRIASVLIAAEVGTWTYEIGPNRVVADANLARILGISPSEARGSRIETYLHAIHPDDRPRTAEAIETAIREGTNFVAEYRILHRDDSTRWVIARGTVERDEAGTALRLPGVILDITDRVKAETARHTISEELERQARVVETVMSTIADFAYTFDRDGRFVYVNKALLDLWGLELEDAVGKNFYELQYPEELAARLQEQIQQVFRTKQPLSDETPYTSPTGAGGYYEYIFKPVLAADGSVELVAGSTRDITERKRVEEELSRSEIRLRQLADTIPQLA